MDGTVQQGKDGRIIDPGLVTAFVDTEGINTHKDGHFLGAIPPLQPPRRNNY